MKDGDVERLLSPDGDLARIHVQRELANQWLAGSRLLPFFRGVVPKLSFVLSNRPAEGRSLSIRIPGLADGNIFPHRSSFIAQASRSFLANCLRNLATLGATTTWQ